MKAIVYIGTSLDGFIARNDGDLDWLTPFANEEAEQSYHEFIKNIDAVVIGRGTFEKVLTFPSWPYEIAVFVLSTTMKELPDNLKDKATILSLQPAEVLTHLSAKGFSNVYIDGANVIQRFLKEDLIDELTISTVPIMIGEGIALFKGLNRDLSFKHIRTVVQSNGLVRNYYERKKSERGDLPSKANKKSNE